jgi:hypothetical protein
VRDASLPKRKISPHLLVHKINVGGELQVRVLDQRQQALDGLTREVVGVRYVCIGVAGELSPTKTLRMLRDSGKTQLGGLGCIDMSRSPLFMTLTTNQCFCSCGGKRYEWRMEEAQAPAGPVCR